MFKAKCKCLNCKHLDHGIYFQKNEAYNRIRLQISQAIINAEYIKDFEIYSWLKELNRNLETFYKYYTLNELEQEIERTTTDNINVTGNEESAADQ